MNTYKQYKDSGIEWIGEIPEHWEFSRLKFVGQSIIGLTYSPEEVMDDESGYLVLRSSNIQNGKLSLHDNVYVKKEIDEKLITRRNDILLCARKGSADLVGKNILIDERTEGQSFGAFMTIFRGKFNQFVYWFFNSSFFDAQKGAFSTSTINQLTSSILNNLLITLPPLAEQTAIANYLDTKTAEIDQTIADKEALINLFEEEKKALINEAVTKGLNPKVSLKPSGIDWLGDIPEHWEVKKLKYLSAIISKGTTPSTVGGEVTDNANIIFIKAENIKNNKLDFSSAYFINEDTNKLISRSTLQENDILFVIAGATIGKVAILSKKYTPANTNQAISFIRLNYEENQKLVWYWLQSLKIQEQLWLDAVQSAQPNLSMENLGNFYIPHPPKSEQTTIVQYIETEIASTNKKINLIKQEVELLKEYRQALIFEAVTGKICVLDHALQGRKLL